jgi:hypothetical protein
MFTSGRLGARPHRAQAADRTGPGRPGHVVLKGKIAMFMFLTRSRYGPLVQVALGAAFVLSLCS